ncbi:succinylglutamic semialdehyde dehydrogenase [Novosphingobium sp. SG751A]|uniref:succinylglutamate-semialdehyde dehydrogenase n=1 Tax=Novosphingobium sp. SG751A TaxID=2587000 RepID=UPI0015542CDB|nr:succinylglutamate-semialdehyde dehydrogenase [Novosphingobium sp. SG751A]NOW44947.1 succinylglutamic semialdehyde dehydrogenase [Novosphingobium sp. SG751A]
MTTVNMQSICPATGETVWSGPQATNSDVVRAVERARHAFRRWRATKLDHRVDIARAYAAALTAHTDRLAELISRETGKPLWEARQEVGSMTGKVELSITAQQERAGERHAETAFGASVLRHRPHGVMAVFGPYNFPGHLPNGHIVPALLAGNTVVFKPSELAPAVGEAMAELWLAAGLPQDVLTVVQGGRETGAALAATDIDGLLFTGSAATGAILRANFATRPNVLLALELGGNNPLVVWDGDVSEAAAIVTQSAFITSGQRCSCARRLIVPDDGFGESVVQAVQEQMAHLTIGAWNDETQPYMGPLISDRAAKLARTQVDRLIQIGARTLLPFDIVGGRREAFVTPALFDVTGIKAPDDEIFAPVLQVTRVANFNAAIAEANNTRFGLAAGLVTSDNERWDEFILEVKAGVVNRNRPTTGASGAAPFGGLGESGNHRPSAFYAADYCAFPIASFEAATATGNADSLKGMLKI